MSERDRIVAMIDREKAQIIEQVDRLTSTYAKIFALGQQAGMTIITAMIEQGEHLKPSEPTAPAE